MTHRSSETDTAPCHQLVFERVCVIPGAGTSHRSFAVRLIAMCTFVFFHVTLQTSPMLIPVAPTHLCSQLHLHKGSRGHNSPVVAAPLAQEPGNRLEASQFPAVPSRSQSDTLAAVLACKTISKNVAQAIPRQMRGPQRDRWEY